jgi:uncharacterized protein YjbJ (UPF0337 family)
MRSKPAQAKRLHEQRSATIMENDRLLGIGHEIEGFLKQAAGKVLGDTKMRIEGSAETKAGKLQNARGRAEDEATSRADPRLEP